MPRLHNWVTYRRDNLSGDRRADVRNSHNRREAKTRQTDTNMQVIDHNDSPESRLTFYIEWKRLTGVYPS